MEFRGLLLVLLGLLLGDTFGSPDGNHILQVQCNSECPTWFNQVCTSGTISCVCGDTFGSPDGNHILQVQCNSECPTWFNQVCTSGTISCVCGDTFGSPDGNHILQVQCNSECPTWFNQVCTSGTISCVCGDTFGSPDGNHILQVQCDSECPTWFNQVCTSGTISCVCGDTFGGAVECDRDSNSSILRFDFCMTYSEVDNSTLITKCPYIDHRPDVEGLYVQLPESVCVLNEFMCGGLNRTGLLCSDCEAGLGPAVFSYTRPCLKCLDSGYGWLLYMFLATFPTTAMFLVILFCHITAAPLNAFIFICQAVISIVNTNPHISADVSKPGNHLTSLFLTVYGVWNLDFSRYIIIPPFCISSTMTSIQALSLEYIVAFYPLFLIVALYTSIQLHASGCWVLVYLWQPFKNCCACIGRRLNPSRSLVHAFAAFLLLSYSKILFVSYITVEYKTAMETT